MTLQELHTLDTDPAPANELVWSIWSIVWC